MTPEQLFGNWGNLFELAGAQIAATSEPTHVPGRGTSRTIDFALCSPAAHPWIRAISVDYVVEAAPHRVVRISLSTRSRISTLSRRWPARSRYHACCLLDALACRFCPHGNRAATETSHAFMKISNYVLVVATRGQKIQPVLITLKNGCPLPTLWKASSAAYTISSTRMAWQRLVTSAAERECERCKS